MILWGANSAPFCGLCYYYLRIALYVHYDDSDEIPQMKAPLTRWTAGVHNANNDDGLDL